jgi:hypothetical protein
MKTVETLVVVRSRPCTDVKLVNFLTDTVTGDEFHCMLHYSYVVSIGYCDRYVY